MENEKYENDVIEITSATDENRIGNFHTIHIKSNNNKITWELYFNDFIELQTLCMKRFKKIQTYANLYSFFSKTSYFIISLLSLLNSALAMVDINKYVIVILSYLITFIGMMNSAFSFEKKAEDFYFISKEYENIGYKIKHILYNSDYAEKNPEEWYDIINSEIDILDQMYFTNMNRLSQKSFSSKSKTYNEFQNV